MHDICGMKVAFRRNEQTRSNLLTQLELNTTESCKPATPTFEGRNYATEDVK